tara:strand:+ start:1422 stop:2831 length:1410 start_codon:yes stop_codon:yes gene_type:complete
MSSKKSALVWFRRDLRIADNHALFKACEDNDKVYCVFVFDKNILDKLPTNDRRLTFIYESIQEMQEALGEHGANLHVLYGDPVEEIPSIAEKLKVSAVYTNRDYESYAIHRDKKVKQSLAKLKIDFFDYKDHVIFEKEEVLTQNETYYKVFTPYKKQWLLEFHKNKPQVFKVNYTKLCKSSQKKIPELADMNFEHQRDNLFQGGRKQALKHWDKFKKSELKNYKKARDFPAKSATSNLSPYLRFGNISIRELCLAVHKSKSLDVQTWLSELIWRDFYQMILAAFPYVEKSAFKQEYSKIRWPGGEREFQAWKEGKTGYPIVDAAMRHFAETGWMHNRLRMVVAMFLTKDLMVNWQWGEAYFAEKLLDFELASNNGGWQWSASTGVDAQPYFRIFNPYSQSEKFDPEGEFIKQHLPELKNFSKKHVHNPSLASPLEQAEAGCQIGKDYPAPIVDHKAQRIKALDLFKKVK